MEVSKCLRFGRISVSSTTKVLIIVGIGVAGAIILVNSTRRRWRRGNMVGSVHAEDFGAFIERFELLPAPQPPSPVACHKLTGLTFAVSDNFDIKDQVTGFGNPDWKRTHEPSNRTAVVVSILLKHGGTCIGRTVMDELAFGITGENIHFGTPTNPDFPQLMPGGSASGSGVAVAAGLVDFALATDTVGCIRIPASLCGIFGFRTSHGILSTIGVLMNSKSLETVGFFARDISTLHRVGHTLLPDCVPGPKRTRQFIVADDCFQLSKIPKQKTIDALNVAVQRLSGYNPLKHIVIGQYIASQVPSLKEFYEASVKMQKGMSALKALSTVMLMIQRYEFKTIHEEWVRSVKPKLGPDVSSHVLAAIESTHESNKSLYKVRNDLRTALNSLLKEGGILVVPTVPDAVAYNNSKKTLTLSFEDRTFTLLNIAGMSGCCQVTIPLGKHDGYPVSLSFLTTHGGDKFLLDTVLDVYSSLQEEVTIVTSLQPTSDVILDMDASELLKEKGNAAFKGKQWNKAVSYYSEAIKLNNTCATYYCNRAAAYLELGCFQQAEADCSQAILLDKKNVKGYLRRGTAREILLSYKDAAEDFNSALVLEPQNKTALAGERRLRKLMCQCGSK